MLADDPEAPTTIRRRFNYPAADRRQGRRARSSSTRARSQAFDPLAGPGSSAAVNAAAAPPRKQASNFLVVAPQRSATGNSLAVMGPQLGYYYPEIVQQIDLHGPGINAQGIARPRPRDVHPDRADEELRLEPHLGRPRRPRRVRREALQARRLGAHARLDPLPVQGQVPGAEGLRRRPAERASRCATRPRCTARSSATATVGGKPYALSRKRSTFGRDGLNLAALQGHDRGQGDHAAEVLQARRTSSASRSTGPTPRARRTAYFTSGRLPRARRAGSTAGCPRSAPASTSGRASCAEREHPHDVGGPGGLLLNWNNQSAPGLHARRRRALRLGAPGRAVRQVAEAGRGITDVVERHEPRRHRGRALAGLAGGEQGPARRPGAERARRSRS